MSEIIRSGARCVDAGSSLRRVGHGAARAVALLAALVAGLLVGPAAGSAASTVPPIPGGGAPVDEGSVVVTDPNGFPLAGGASATLFSLELPEGAACPGDSASQNWYVQGFLIPSGDDPGTVEYGVIGPEGDQFPLFAFDSKPFAHQVTQVSSTPGGPGVISRLPALTFGVFSPGDIPAGTYRIGVACTFFRQTATYWDTEIVIEADPDDTPAGLRFSVPGAPEGAVDPSDRNGWSLWFTLAVVMGVAALVLVVVGALRNRARPNTQNPTYDNQQPEVSS